MPFPLLIPIVTLLASAIGAAGRVKAAETGAVARVESARLTAKQTMQESRASPQFKLPSTVPTTTEERTFIVSPRKRPKAKKKKAKKKKSKKGVKK